MGHETDIEWMTRIVVEALEEVLDQVANEDRIQVPNDVRIKSRDAMIETLKQRWVTTEEQAAGVRAEMSDSELRAHVRAMVEPTFRKRIAHRRPS